MQAILASLNKEDGAAGRTVLGRMGFKRTESALRDLKRLTQAMTPSVAGNFLKRALAPLAHSADPDLALIGLVRFAEARFGPEQIGQIAKLSGSSLALIAKLFGFSQFLTDLMIRYPDYLEWLEQDPALHQAREVEEMKKILGQAVGSHTGTHARRLAAIRAQRRELLRLGVRRMLALSDEMEMAGELSDLALATLALALEEVSAPLIHRFGEPMEEGEEGAAPFTRRAGFAIIAMGKLGGRELNFSSDIDLLFIYSDEGRTAGLADQTGRITNHLFFTRLAEALTSYLADPSDEGSFYRVDTRLRPDGESGPLVRSLQACEIYYETQARLWEKLALLKARAVAGDTRLGQAFESMSRPLVFDPLHTGEIIPQIYDLKQRIDHEIGLRNGAEREVKRGAGGIREIEFLVQTMQMLQGAHDPRMWTPRTLEAIERLHTGGLIEPARAEQMARDYLFLRTIEHRLQMVHLRQTHMIPEEPEALDALALRCGLAPEGPERPGQALLRRWSEVSHRVHKEFLDFFAPPEAPAEDSGTGVGGEGMPTPRPRESPEEHTARLVLSSVPEGALLEQLAAFGLGSAGSLKALRRLGGLGRQVYLTTEGSQLYRQLLPLLLRAAKVNPQPEVALANLESFLAASGAMSSFYAIFLQNPPVFELLMLAFGSGSTLAQTLSAHPEFLDAFSDPAFFSGPIDREALGARLGQWTRRATSAQAFSSALARMRRFEFLAAGLGEIAGLLDYPSSCQRLSVMAEVIIEQALARAAGEMGLEPAPKKFAVLAMGKLGTGELNYYSDLDLIFVWDEGFAPGRPSAGEAAAELGNRVIGLLTDPTPEGMPFSVDTRLRPEGQNAPLAPPLARYEEYYADRAQTWEFQSAMKMRLIAGDTELARELMSRIGRIIAGRTQGLNLAVEIRAMRKRMEAAIKLPRWIYCDFKTGPGGTVDLEFIAQYLQLRHLAGDPALMGLGPLAVFRRLVNSGRLNSELGKKLICDYVWARRLERRARLLFESDRSQIPSGGEKLTALERACEGLLQERGAASLHDAVGAALLANRRHFDQIVQDAP